MAISRVKTSSVLQGFPKSRSMLAGNAAYDPTNFESIATANGTGSSRTITFSSIPSTYTHLQIRFMALTASSTDYCILNFNGDTSTNYTWHVIDGDGSAANVFSQGNATYTYVNYDQSMNSTYPTTGVIDIHDYANTSKFKTTKFINGIDRNGTGNVELHSALWRSTSAISSITLQLQAGSVNFATTTIFALYGIR